MLNTLRVWGDRWLVDEPPVVIMHSCGHPLYVVPVCAHCGEPARPREETDWSDYVFAPGWDRHGPTEHSH